MSAHNMFRWRNKNNINTFGLEKKQNKFFSRATMYELPAELKWQQITLKKFFLIFAREYDLTGCNTMHSDKL